MQLLRMASCAVMEVHGVWNDSPKVFLSQLWALRKKHALDWLGLIISFREGGYNRGEDLLKYIEDKSLGKVSSITGKNPNTLNNVTIATWVTDWAAWKDWAKSLDMPVERDLSGNAEFVWNDILREATTHSEDCNCYICSNCEVHRIYS